MEFFNGHPVIRTTAENKTVSAVVDKIEAHVPQRILKRQQQEDRMDIDDENRPKKTTKETSKTKTLPFWEELRKGADVSDINDKLLETVIPITLKELLSISPDLISHWFGNKRVPPLQSKEKDLKEGFEVSNEVD